MRYIIVLLLAALFIYSCEDKPLPENNIKWLSSYKPYAFLDSTSLGSNIAIMLDALGTEDDPRIRLRLFTFNDSIGWQIKQSFDSLYPTLTWKAEVEFVDYDKDSKDDVLVDLGTGGRSGNRLFQLFLFKPIEKSLKKIKGFDDICNPEPDSITNEIQGLRLLGDAAYYETYSIIDDSVKLVKSIKDELEDD